jgi:hypothetical protein
MQWKMFRFFRRQRVREISSETKAALEILISEIQEANPPDDIKALLDIWIRGSDLHPERVGKIEGSSALQK